MDSSVDATEQEEKEESSPPDGPRSPHMDRNPSPPPDRADGEEGDDLDAIGDTAYSKHWLFSTLTRLIQMVAEEKPEVHMQLSDDEEEDLCRVWDMAMDKFWIALPPPAGPLSSPEAKPEPVVGYNHTGWRANLMRSAGEEQLWRIKGNRARGFSAAQVAETGFHSTEKRSYDVCHKCQKVVCGKYADVAGFLQEFKAADILLGIIAKSRSPRLTEICVGILGNIACFPDTCASLSQNDDLGAVLLLLLGDADPPTLLETTRLLLTCLSQKEVCSLWLQRIRQQTSVCSNLCFIMSSSTNTDLLEKVGELVDKLFDLDEELMKCWLTSQPRENEGDGEIQLDLSSCLLEAAKQLRSESSHGLEVYFHILQLLTTVEEGLQIFAAPDGPGKPAWEFVSDVVCKDLCQPNDLPVILLEQKGILIQALSVLQALYRCQDQWCSSNDTGLSLIGSVFRVCQHHSEFKPESSDKDAANDEQLQTLAEITSEFLADFCINIQKDTVADLIRKGYLTPTTCQAAASCLLPNFKTSFQHLQAALSETDPQLADVMRSEAP